MTEVGGISLGKSGKLYFDTSLSQTCCLVSDFMLRFVALSSQVLLSVIAEELTVAQVYFELTVCQVCYKVKQLARVKSSTWRVKFKYC